jgi:hypothetical protein
MADSSPGVHSGLVIYGKDIGALAEFYRSVLSMEIVERDDRFVVLHAGPVEIVVVQVPDNIAASIDITKPPAVRTGTPLKPMFTVPSLIEVRSNVLRNGGTLQPPESAWRFRGAIVLDGCDREGNVIQFRQLDL